MPRFRKKPVEIEARQLHGDSADQIIEWIATDGRPRPYYHPTTGTLYVPTMEGDMRAMKGDWIIRGVAGEFYPCKPDIFAATYDPVDAPGDSREPH